MIQIEVLKDNQVTTTYSLEKPVYTLGRSEENDIVLEHPKVSRVHAKLHKTDKSYRLQDMNSTNYVFVNGLRIKEKALESGDKVQISSDITLRFIITDASIKASPFAQTQIDLQKNFIHKDELNHLKEVTTKIASADSLEDTLESILKEGLDLTHAERGFIVLQNYKEELLWEHARSQGISLPTSPNETFEISQSIIDDVIKSKKIIVKLTDTAQMEPTQSMTALKIYSVMCVPLIFKSKILGVFYVDAQKMPNNFTESDQSLLLFLAEQASVAIMNSRRISKLQKDLNRMKQTHQTLMAKLKNQGTDTSFLSEHDYSAGGFVLSNSRKLLIVKQSNNTWSLPKGRIEVGEESAVAAMREIYEESGLMYLQMLKQLPSYTRSGLNSEGVPDEKIQKTIFMYLFRAEEVPLKPKDPENPEARWLDLNEAIQLLSHPADKLYVKKQLQALKIQIKVNS